MKNLVLLFVFVSISAVTQAQKSAIFKHKVLPNHTYSFTRTDGFDMDVTTTDTATKKDTSGVQLFKNIQLRTVMESGSSVKTAAAKASQPIPITMTCTKSSSKATFNGTVYPTPPSNPGEGEHLDGQIDQQFSVHVDTTVATAGVKAAAQSTIGDIPTKIKFPDAAMKIGESFTQEESMTRLDVPGFDKDKEYMMKVTYKLTAIKDNLAYFDTSAAFDMDVDKDVMGHAIKVTSKGSGDGKVVFNIAKQFPQSLTRDFTMIVNVGDSLTKLNMKVNMRRDEHCVISTN